MREPHPFPFDAEAGLVMQEFGQEVSERLRESQYAYVDPRNIQRFVHGRSWQSHQSYDPDQVSELSSHEHQMNIRFDDIMLRRLEIIENTLNELSNEMSESFIKSLYSTVSDVCNKHGNVVNAQKEPAKGFIEMLEKIEFGVDRNGDVSIPQIHGGAKAIEALRRDHVINSIEFENKVAKLKEIKTQQALDKEAVRKAKFVKGAR